MRNDLQSPEQANQAYLTAGLAWLRLRLRRAIESLAAADDSAQLGEDRIADLEAESAAAERRMAAAEESAAPPAMSILARRLGLSNFERRVLLLCAATELDTRIASLCGAAQGDPRCDYPTFALAFALFDDAAWEALSPERPLRRWRLVEIHQAAATPLVLSPLSADERIVSFLKGLNYVDPRLDALLAPLNLPASERLPSSQEETVEAIVGHVAFAARRDAGPAVVQLLGPDALSKQAIACRACEELGLDLLRMPAEFLPQQTGELETIALLWRRETMLTPVALLIDGLDEAHGGEGRLSLLRRFVARSGGLIFIDSREMRHDLGRSCIGFDVAKPTPGEQRTVWQDVLGDDHKDEAARLADQFAFDMATIEQLSQLAEAATAGDAMTPAQRLWSVCRRHARPGLDALAQRIDVRASWDDLVLPDEQLAQLRRIVQQVRSRRRVYDEWGFRDKMNRGLGISALFVGESGVGKGLGAEVVAHELDLDLFRLDLSSVISKYIGETEKNLRRVFDAADDGGAILFFDEADALFGKRSEVKDSHDRYANIEINYLLQRIESYRGLAILATNWREALDSAFLRRLRFVVKFPFPEPSDRQRIWRGAFAAAPRDELDYEWLSRLKLAGGAIHNIALNAAFAAADCNAIAMPVVLEEARTELQKLQMPLHGADFQWRGGETRRR
jgi:hypothetical protein